jgi:phosphate starvation-inducible protein PhoH and related proteins
MYFKPLLPIMFLLSKTLAFQSMNLQKLNQRPTHLIMRLKKTMSNGFDPDMSGGSRKSRTKSLAPLYKPRSENQRQYVAHLGDDSVPIVLGIGPAGCGKTLFACVSAIDGLKRGLFQKIVLTRPVVPVEEEELGFLPGTLVKKMDPWTRPLMDIFLEHYPQHEIDFMIGSGVIEISPLAYMRGRTFKRSFIIADEMQNSSPGQMLMLTTRIGEGSKMVITGDLKQSDRCADNGLLDIMEKIRAHRKINGCDVSCNVGIEMVEMNKGDIERSPIVSKILEIYNPSPSPSPIPPLSVDDSHSEIKNTSMFDVVLPTLDPTVPFTDDNDNDSQHECSFDDEIKAGGRGLNDAALIPIQHISKNKPI